MPSPFWYSKKRLALGSLISAILIWYLEEPVKAPEVEKVIIEDLIEDVDYAVDAMDYMAGLKNGKSVIRGVIEKEQPVVEWYWTCTRQPASKTYDNGWIENDGLYIFSAYFDDRPNSLFPSNPSVQVLTMSWRTLEKREEVYCTLISDKGSTVVKAYIREIWQRAWDPRDHFYVPNLISCPVPARMRESLEMTVYLSKKPCVVQKSALMVTFPEKAEDLKDVAVCVKGMDFQEDLSTRLIQWLEAQFLFGADSVTLYTYSVSQNTSRVLKHYGELGKVTQVELSLPADSPNFDTIRSGYIWRNRQQKRRHELIPYNDCLYRYLHTHKYILILDTDEVVVPKRHETYGEMLDEVEDGNKGKRISSVVVRNVFKFPTMKVDPKVPEYMFMLKNNRRSRKTSGVGEYGKSFSRVSNVATVFNHFALHRLSPTVSSSVYLSEETAVKLHYKEKCPIESQHECDKLTNETVIDNSLDKFRTKLTKRVQQVIKDMGI